LKNEEEGQDDEENYHGPNRHGVDPDHVGMAVDLWWTLFTSVISKKAVR
jgi:hypothetical protein